MSIIIANFPKYWFNFLFFYWNNGKWNFNIHNSVKQWKLNWKRLNPIFDHKSIHKFQSSKSSNGFKRISFPNSMDPLVITILLFFNCLFWYLFYFLPRIQKRTNIFFWSFFSVLLYEHFYMFLLVILILIEKFFFSGDVWSSLLFCV